MRLSYLHCFVACSLSTLSISLFAAEKNTKDKSQIEEIVVYADQTQGLSSTRTISREQIKKTPNGNGNITDYLKTNPHIRFEQSDKDGTRSGEIKPENISINGAEPNQTAFFIDNVNVNNDLMVDSEIFDGAIQVIPGLGHSQAYFFDGNLLSSVVVHDSNISASLGGFSGGAVVAKTKQYDGRNGIKLNYRTSGSNWAKLHADQQLQDKLQSIVPDPSLQAPYQPKYSKRFFNIMAETALSENIGMVIGLSRRGTNIQQSKLVSKDGKRDHQFYRFHSDNALLNLNWTPNADNRFELGLRYSNYRESKFYPNTLNNNVKDYHQAYGATLAWVHSFDSGVLTSTLAYDNLQDKRDSESSDVEVISLLDFDYEIGGYGDSRLTQRNLSFSTEYALNPFDWGAVNHAVSLGGLYQFSQYKFNRAQEVTSKVGSIIDGIYIPLLERELIARKGSADTKYQNAALYAEDLMQWGNFELRTGIRAERDDYLKNNNIAPRLVGKWKPFSQTGFIAGYNRYYGRSFASLKLTDKILALNENKLARYEKLKHLKTPYADELSLGLEQNWGNFAFNLKYIYRQNRQRIILARYKNDNGESVDEYRNGNPYNVNVYTFQINNIEPWKLGNTYWNTRLAFDWLDTKLSDIHRQLDPKEIVVLNGKPMTREEMQRRVNANNGDWTLRFNLDMALPEYGLSWSNNLWVKAAVKGYEEIRDLEYRTYDYGTHPQWDMRLRWQPTIYGQHKPYVQVDVLNVLDKTRKILKRSGAENFGEYTPGREFWLEVGYEF
ncbi:outer membrane receptor protein involved in Fe transport [Mesocricetibacter intestinalis]|uniref:Outer membrane receptor protein involved in Fe transport n=1 Tax=Mesocricetibacter intestinalis TaxID=1521930 RepID=A0A4R6VB79_9PAST|nr:TonB-dependent receptor plug domain-containing protein [Mesocricetibacter intestinalis]TDQ59437.1 outer membrane receptor protein involved in Fe transport [Mesocricetibacter intestinalis]